MNSTQYYMNFLLMTTKQLEYQEGNRDRVYLCTNNKKTIGCGRNLDDNPIDNFEKNSVLNWQRYNVFELNELLASGDILMDKERALNLLLHEVITIHYQIKSRIECYNQLSVPRKAVLVSMAFQMGFSGLLGFKNTLKAFRKNDFKTAHHEKLDSEWYREDTPGRAKEMALQMELNKWQGVVEHYA